MHKMSGFMPKPARRWGSLLAIALLGSPTFAMLTLIPAAAVAQNVPTAVRQGYTLLGQGLVNQAIAQFQRVLRDNPSSAEARLGLAIAFRRAGRDADAFEAYQRVLEVDPDNRLALLSVGILGGYRPEWQNRGIEALNVLLSQNSNDVEARAQRALLLGYQGRFAESIADYNIVLQANPTPDALLGAAEIYAYSGNYQRSLELFSRARTAGKPITGGAAIAYGIALRETGNPAEAVRVLEAQLRRDSRLDSLGIQTRSALAVAYAANQQIDRAVSVLTPLRGRQDSRTILARALNEISRYSSNPMFAEEAIALYRQVLSDPANLTVGRAREIADVLSGYPGEQAFALEVYRQLAQQQPGDVSLAVRQAVLERELGLLTATTLQQRLQSLLPSIPADPAQQKAIAQALLVLDSPDPGLLPLYQALVNAGVDESFLNFRIAQMLIQRNDLATARMALAAYASTPEGMRDQYANLLLLAEIDRRENNLEASAQRYQTILAANPSDSGVTSAALQGLAGIRQTQGRLVEAIALYDQVIARNPQDTAKILGRTSLAYQAQLISQPEAEAVLNGWLATRPLTDTPPELVSLAGALPANPQREGLYNALLAADPNNVAIQLRLAQVLAARDPNLARAQIARLVARDPNNLGAYFVQGQLSQQLGDLSDASSAYETILRLEPNNTDALAALGGIRFQQRRYDSANQIYNEVLVLDPSNQVAQSSLVSLTAVQGRPLEALQQLEQIQLQQSATGTSNPAVIQQMRQIREGLLQQRGFQPPWERF